MIVRGKPFIYVVKFKKNDKQYEFAFGNLDTVRVHLTYGWQLPYDESKVIDSDKNGIIYNQDGIVIEQISLVKEN